MSKQRHRQRNQGGTTTETRPQAGSGVAQFSVSEVAQFSMSVDNPLGAVLTAQALVSATLGAPELLPELVETIRTGLQMGLEARPLFAQRWEEGWARPLVEWREALQLRPFAERVGRL